jgi:hypothetical protein
MFSGDNASHLPTVVGVAGGAYTYLGLPLAVWVSIATLTYLVIQIVGALPRAWRTFQLVYRRLRGQHVESIDQRP